ncbi:hypothetical protein NDU88_003892 [Pleurodeles waltl]|uniref:Uncharacterized protein n=1 Tax=Pleurodeles waltl TaxID=8319 RepID=A0AAV7MRW0_PLEWA|nr:hypothetical protein NDU88_003892 [Pleurodeles waltl]
MCPSPGAGKLCPASLESKALFKREAMQQNVALPPGAGKLCPASQESKTLFKREAMQQNVARPLEPVNCV